MHSMRTLSAFALALLLVGCGGSSSLTPVEVAGRYAFTEYKVNPTAGSVDSKDLRREIGDDVTLLLTEAGAARIETLRDGSPDELLASGSFTIDGGTVRVAFGDLGALGRRLLMPRNVDFEADDDRLRAEVFLTDVNLEDLDDDDYGGITRADVNIEIELREIGS